MDNYNVLDISAKIDDLPKCLKLSEDKKFVIKEDRKTVMKVMALTKKAEMTNEDMDEVVKLLLGEDGFAELDSMNLSYKNYITVVKGMMALISGNSLEEFEERFQNASSK